MIVDDDLNDEIKFEKLLKPPPKKKNQSIKSIFISIGTGLKELFLNPCTRWLLIGNLILSICQYIFSYSLVKYFNFYHKENTFAMFNALCIILGGCTSCLLSGKLAETLDQTTYRAKSLVSTCMCLIAVPTCIILFVVHFDMYFSVFFLFIYDILCLGYYAPIISMVQATVDSQKKGAAIGAFGFSNNMV